VSVSPPGCYWLAQSSHEVPDGNGWLSPREAQCFDRLRFPKRRADWRLGRWTAKRAVSGHLGLPQSPAALAAIEVLPSPSGAPEVYVSGRPAPVTISLSHSGSAGFCAVAGLGVELGCDVETVAARSPAFLADYFTVEEQALVARTPPGERDLLTTMLWSAKESVLKALRSGLRADTRWVNVTSSPASPGSWWPLHACHISGRIFRGWWRETAGFVWTVVAEPLDTETRLAASPTASTFLMTAS